MVFGNLLLLLLMWGVSLHIWTERGINYVKLLALHHTEFGSAKHVLNHMSIYSISADLTIFYLLFFVLFNKMLRSHYIGEEYTHLVPLLMTLYFAYRLIYPFASRRLWWNMLGRVFAAPFYPVIFRDGYIGDLLTSLVRVFVPLAYSLAILLIVVYGWVSNSMDLATAPASILLGDSYIFNAVIIPTVTLSPLFIRLLQCLRRSVDTGNRWPHMANALKYTSAILVLSVGIFRPNSRGTWSWILSFILATLFQFLWDVFQDWALVTLVTQPSLFGVSIARIRFRRQRLLGPLSLYLGVLVFNFILRFAWALTLLPPPEMAEDGVSSTSSSSSSMTASSPLYVFLFEHATPIAAAVEVVRRMVWGILRLEQEQLELIDDDSLLSSRDGALGAPHSRTMPAELADFDKVRVKVRVRLCDRC